MMQTCILVRLSIIILPYSFPKCVAVPRLAICTVYTLIRDAFHSSSGRTHHCNAYETEVVISSSLGSQPPSRSRTRPHAMHVLPICFDLRAASTRRHNKTVKWYTHNYYVFCARLHQNEPGWTIRAAFVATAPQNKTKS